MELEATIALLRRAANLDVQQAEAPGVTAAIVDVRRVRSFVEALDLRLHARLAEVASFPEGVSAQATKSTLSRATKRFQQAEIAGAVGALAAGLQRGDITLDHVDMFRSATAKLDSETKKAALADSAPHLVTLGSSGSIDDFRVALDREARRIDATDGMAEYERQRRAIRLRAWLDRRSGMLMLRGAFDPAAGAVLQQRLNQQLATEFAEGTPEHAPSDPLEKQDFLRAHALLALVRGVGGGSGRPELIIVRDERQPPTDPPPPDQNRDGRGGGDRGGSNARSGSGRTDAPSEINGTRRAAAGDGASCASDRIRNSEAEDGERDPTDRPRNSTGEDGGRDATDATERTSGRARDSNTKSDRDASGRKDRDSHGRDGLERLSGGGEVGEADRRQVASDSHTNTRTKGLPRTENVRTMPVAAPRTSVSERVVYDCGLDTFIPSAVIDELVLGARVIEVVVRNGVVVSAPGTLNLGRSSRLPNVAQRRVLRGLYATCAVPGCAVRYDNTRIHHIRFWRQGGCTNLDNLLPLCVRHHHAVHDRGWKIAMRPDRSLTIDCGNGFIMTTGPPSRTTRHGSG